MFHDRLSLCNYYKKFLSENIKTSQKSIVTAILACDPSGTIALNDDIPWNIPDERQYFLKMVENSSIIMGSKTYVSLPKNFTEKYDITLISNTISKTAFSKNNHNNVIIVRNLTMLKEVLKKSPKHYFMIGGAQTLHSMIESQMINYFLLTFIKQKFDGDTYIDLRLLTNNSVTLFSNDVFEIKLYKHNDIAEN